MAAKGKNRKLFLPNSSPIPNFLFDVVLPDKNIPHATLRVLLLLYRKTSGWDKLVDDLSLSEIERGAAVARHTAIHAVRIICDVWRLFDKTRGYRGRNISSYRIRRITADEFEARLAAVEELFGTCHPNEEALREKPSSESEIKSIIATFGTE